MRALLPLLALAGCSDIPKARTEQEIRDLARQELAGVVNAVDHNAGIGNQQAERTNQAIEDLRRRVADLEQENRVLRADVDSQRRQLLLIQ